MLHEVGASRVGGAWVGIRQHDAVPGSRYRLVRLDDEGRVRSLTELDSVNPFAVACDGEGECWVADQGFELLKFNTDGKQDGLIALEAVAVTGNRDRGGCWVCTVDKLLRLDDRGNAVWSMNLDQPVAQACMATSGY